MVQSHQRCQSYLVFRRILCLAPYSSWRTYINDSILEPLDHDTHITLYVDDILLYRTITAPSDYVILQNDINTLSNWVSRNNLTLNPSTCKHLVISKLRKHSVEVPILTLNNEVLEKVSFFLNTSVCGPWLYRSSASLASQPLPPHTQL